MRRLDLVVDRVKIGDLVLVARREVEAGRFVVPVAVGRVGLRRPVLLLELVVLGNGKAAIRIAHADCVAVHEVPVAAAALDRVLHRVGRVRAVGVVRVIANVLDPRDTVAATDGPLGLMRRVDRRIQCLQPCSVSLRRHSRHCHHGEHKHRHQKQRYCFSEQNVSHTILLKFFLRQSRRSNDIHLKHPSIPGAPKGDSHDAHCRQRS